MQKIKALPGYLILGMTLAILLVSCTTKEEAHQPNVLIIYTDDHNFEHIGVYGGNVLTPNIDRICQ